MTCCGTDDRGRYQAWPVAHTNDPGLKHAPAQGGWTSGLLAVLSFALMVTGCRSFRPEPDTYRPHLTRAESQTNGPLQVSVAVLGRDEAKRLFGLPLHKKSIQPVWLRLENTGTNEYYFLSVSVDPDYFSPAEVAYIYSRWYSPGRNRKISDFMQAKQIPYLLKGKSRLEGFLFANYDPGAKHVKVELLGDQELVRFEFVAPVPGRRFDFQGVDFDRLLAGQSVTNHTRAALKAVLEALPATTTDARRSGSGDPVNLVVVGADDAVSLAFARQGWDLTETLTTGSALRLIATFLSNSRWRTSPVSPLYLFGRRQDLALQKARSTIHERNHLRLWLAPFTCEGQPVWVGQISRDIGLRFTTRAPGWVTHKIDPDVDEARDYLTQDMLVSQSVSHLAYVPGVGRSTPDHLQRNLTGDPYYTDGHRVVLFVTRSRVPANEVNLLEWHAWPQSRPREQTVRQP